MIHIHVLRPDASPAGPFSEEEIRAQMARGELSPADHAWYEGLAEWQTLAEMFTPEPAPPEPAPSEPAPPAKGRTRATRSRKRVPPVHVMRGMTEFLEVFPDRLTITPRGGLGLKTNGSTGIRTIFLKMFVALEFKLPPFTSGSLEFTLSETAEKPTGGGEANVFRFMKTEENIAAAARIKEYVEGRVRENHAVPLKLAPASLSAELSKLAVLREQGVLTETEFQQAKQRLLG